MGTVDRDDWSRKRIAFLEEQLKADHPEDVRTAMEKELTELRAGRSWWRRLFWPVRLPR